MDQSSFSPAPIEPATNQATAPIYAPVADSQPQQLAMTNQALPATDTVAMPPVPQPTEASLPGPDPLPQHFQATNTAPAAVLPLAHATQEPAIPLPPMPQSVADLTPLPAPVIPAPPPMPMVETQADKKSESSTAQPAKLSLVLLVVVFTVLFGAAMAMGYWLGAK